MFHSDIHKCPCPGPHVHRTNSLAAVVLSSAHKFTCPGLQVHQRPFWRQHFWLNFTSLPALAPENLENLSGGNAAYTQRKRCLAATAPQPRQRPPCARGGGRGERRKGEGGAGGRRKREDGSQRARTWLANWETLTFRSSSKTRSLFLTLGRSYFLTLSNKWC